MKAFTDISSNLFGALAHQVAGLVGIGLGTTRIEIQHVALLGRQAGRQPVQRCAALPFVGAALGHHRDHAAERASVLRAIAARLDLLLRDGLEGQLGVGQKIADVGDVEAVDVVAVLTHRGATE
jgi:hypothetical protein